MTALIPFEPKLQQVLFYLGRERLPVGVQFDESVDPKAVAIVQAKLSRAWRHLPSKVRAMVKSKRIQWLSLEDLPDLAGRYAGIGGHPYIKTSVKTILGPYQDPLNMLPISALEYVLAHEIYGHGIGSDSAYKDMRKVHYGMIYAPFPWSLESSHDRQTADSRRLFGRWTELWVNKQLAVYPQPTNLEVQFEGNFNKGLYAASLLLLSCNWRADYYASGRDRRHLLRGGQDMRLRSVGLCPPTWQQAWVDVRPVPKEVGDAIVAEGFSQMGIELEPDVYWRSLKLQDAVVDAYGLKSHSEAMADHLVAEAYGAGEMLGCQRAVNYLRQATDAILAIPRNMCSCGAHLERGERYCGDHRQGVVCFICGATAPTPTTSYSPYRYNLCSRACVRELNRQAKIKAAMALDGQIALAINAYGGVNERYLSADQVSIYPCGTRTFDGRKIVTTYVAEPTFAATHFLEETSILGGDDGADDIAQFSDEKDIILASIKTRLAKLTEEATKERAAPPPKRATAPQITDGQRYYTPSELVRVADFPSSQR